MIPLVGGLLSKVSWKLGVGIAVLAVLYFGYRHYDGLVDDKARLTAENSQLETSNEAQTMALTAWKASQDSLITALADRVTNIEDAAEEGDRLNALFSEHEFSRLAAEKPGLVESRANRGTLRILRMFELTTGSLRADRDTTAAGASPAPAPGTDQDD